MTGDARVALVDHLPARLVERRKPLIETVLALRLRAASAASTVILRRCIIGCDRSSAGATAVAAASGSASLRAGLLLEIGETGPIEAPGQLALAILILVATSSAAARRGGRIRGCL